MIGLAETYGCRPSDFIDDISEYEKYCFDEACALIKAKMKDGKEPNFNSSTTTKKHYKSFSEYYEDIEN